MPSNGGGSQSCSEVWDSKGTLESSNWTGATGGGEVGTSAHPGKVLGPPGGGEVSSGGTWPARAWREGSWERVASDAGG